MAHEIAREGSRLVIAVIGRLDAVSAPELEADALAALDSDYDVTFDLAKLDYISSAGLHVLLVIYKRVEKRGAMHVVNSHGVVADVLVASGFADIFGMAT